MRKLDLRSYDVATTVKGGDGQPIDITAPFNFKDSVINVMFLPALQLKGAELIRQNMLAQKIEACTDDHFMLEEAEYDRLKKAVESYPAQGRHDVEFVDRILNQTPEV